jgi:hypothetical protein
MAGTKAPTTTGHQVPQTWNHNAVTPHTSLQRLDSVNHGFMMFGQTPTGAPSARDLYLMAQQGGDPLAAMGLSNLDSVNHGFMMFGQTPKGAPSAKELYLLAQNGGDPMQAMGF